MHSKWAKVNTNSSSISLQLKVSKSKHDINARYRNDETNLKLETNWNNIMEEQRDRK